MSVEVARLVANLEANVKGFEKQLARAVSQTNRQLGAIEKRANQMRNTLSGTLGRGFAQLAAGVSIAAAGQAALNAVESYTRMTNALKATGLSSDQASAAFDRLFAIAQKNGTAIEPLVTLYSRLGVAQKELGVNTNELTAFTDTVALALRVGGTDAIQARGALLQLSQAMGGTVVRAEEFNSILEGAPTILRAAAAGLKEADGSVAKLRQIMLEGELSSRAFFLAIQAGRPLLQDMAKDAVPTLGMAANRVWNEFVKLAGEIDAAAGISRSAVGAMDNLADGIAGLEGPLVAAVQRFQELGNALQAFMTRYAEALTRLNPTLRGSGINLQGGKAELDRLQRGLLQDMGLDPRAFGLPGNRTGGGFGAGGDFGEPLNRRARNPRGGRPMNLSDLGAGDLSDITQISIKDNPVTGKKEKKKKGAKERQNEFEREIEQIRKRTEALDIEAGVIGRGTLEAAKYRATQELLNAAKEAGIVIGEKERANIDALALQYAEAAAKVEELEKAYEAAQQQAEFFGGLIEGALTDMLINGASAEDVIKRLTAALAEAAIQAALLGKGPLGSLFGGTGLLSGLLGGLTGSGPLKLFADGGYVRGPGTSRSDSIPARLSNGEFVVNAAATRQHGALLEAINNGRNIPMRVSGGGGTVITFAPVIDARGADPAQISMLRAEMRAQAAAMPKVIDGHINTRQSRGVRA